MNEKLIETVLDLSIRLTSLENVLLKKNIITKEEYIVELKLAAEKLQKTIEQLAAETINETDSN
jgi:hypothetical protein